LRDAIETFRREADIRRLCHLQILRRRQDGECQQEREGNEQGFQGAHAILLMYRFIAE
jgi:hypothetical protein